MKGQQTVRVASAIISLALVLSACGQRAPSSPNASLSSGSGSGSDGPAPVSSVPALGASSPVAAPLLDGQTQAATSENSGFVRLKTYDEPVPVNEDFLKKWNASRLRSLRPNLPDEHETNLESDQDQGGETESADPLTPIDLSAPVSFGPPTEPESSVALIEPTALVEPDAPGAPGDFAVFRATDLFRTGQSVSMIGETSVANSKFNVLETYNWGAAISTDMGRSWRYFNPYSDFPASYGGFCCDQIVYYDQSHDLMFWILQYSTNAQNNNAIRVAWSRGSSIATGDFCYTDFTPQQLGSPTGTNYDQPKFARSDDSYFLEITRYGAVGGSVVIRIKADQFHWPSCGGVNYRWFAANVFSPGLVQRAYGTMYAAGHVSNSKLRVFSWPNNSDNYTTNDINHTSYPQNYPYRCPRTGGNATSDWCQRRSFGGGWAHSDRIFTAWIAGGVAHFAWDASQGSGGFGTFAYPYIQMARVNVSNMTLASQPYIWSGSYAFQYAAAALNDRLHVGYQVMYGGGSQFQNCTAFIADDYYPGYTGVGFFPGGGISFSTLWTSNIDPNDTLSGDYYAVRRNDLVPYTWASACYRLRNDGAGGSVQNHPVFTWFGRERDRVTTRVTFLPLSRR